MLKKKKLLPEKQMFINVPFQSTKNRKKDICVGNKVQKFIGDVYCPRRRIEKCVYFSTKTPNLYEFRKCKAFSHLLNFPFKDQKPTIMFFGGKGPHCSARKASCDCGRKTISIFEEVSPPITIKHKQT